MTADEHRLYQRILSSYTSLNTKGEDLFIDLFETDADGIIVFLKPPSKRQTSFEIWMFLMSLMAHQHLRIMRQQVDDLTAEIRGELAKLHSDQTTKKSPGK